MSPRHAADWIKAHSWEVGLALLAVGGWITRAEVAFADAGELHDTVDRDHEIVAGLGRLACIRDRLTAGAAGIPCGDLLNERSSR